jgi:REP element-mobilizing transposase RayT
MLYPMGYHITWGTYGVRLHGSRKPHVDREHNEYGAPLAPTDPEREAEAKARLRSDPVRLTIEQREIVEHAVREVARKYDWTIHAIAPRSDHVHVVLTACREGEQLRDAQKSVATRALNMRFGTRTWWAEKGSAKYLWERSYFENAIAYVNNQRDF